MQRGREGGMPESLLDRLMLNEARIAGMAEGLEQVADLPDPVGRVMDEWTRPNGLVIRKVRVPMGVIGIIYEARPNVTVDAAALAFKAGSAIPVSYTHLDVYKRQAPSTGSVCARAFKTATAARGGIADGTDT